MGEVKNSPPQATSMAPIIIIKKASTQGRQAQAFAPVYVQGDMDTSI